MKINDKSYKTIWFNETDKSVEIIDQTKLPHSLNIISLKNLTDVIIAIKTMQVRGAPLIGGAAAYGIVLAMKEDPTDDNLTNASKKLIESRPTAVNLKSSIVIMNNELKELPKQERFEASLALAKYICLEDETCCELIGLHGKKIISDCIENNDLEEINILTHCNAGWLATIDWGTATSPIYHAIKDGIKVHVWVDETRPRNQGASLTSYELTNEGVANTIISDNAGGLLMREGKVDMCITGTDRVLSNGDIINKIGTYLKALAAFDNNIPFYVALPGTTIDYEHNKVTKNMIEYRSPEELTHVDGIDNKGNLKKVRIFPKDCNVLNPAFDITPGKLITGLITEKGIFESTTNGLIRYRSE
jgi:methylthioribose-1-phosphate isomerase